jgi:hypothetical protein
MSDLLVDRLTRDKPSVWSLVVLLGGTCVSLETLVADSKGYWRSHPARLAGPDSRGVLEDFQTTNLHPKTCIY